MNKIVHITKSLSLGGGPRAIAYICKSMPEIQFILYAIKGPMILDFRSIPNVEVRLVEKWSFSVSLQIYRRSMRENVTAIHVHSMNPAVYFLPFRGVAKIITFHGLHIRAYDFIHAPVRRAFRRFVKNMLVYGFDAGTVLCRSDYSYLEALLYRLDWIRKISVIPNGMNLNEEICAAAPKKLPDETLNFLVISRFDFQKGVDILMELLRRSPEKTIPFRIYFIGDRKMRDFIGKCACEGIHNIEFIEETCYPYDYIKAADYLLIPSRWEGLPLVMLEALWLKTKVLAADTANVNEFADGHNIVLYKQGDQESFWQAVETCFREKDVSSVFPAEELFSLEAVGRKWREMYGKFDKGSL